jgi:TorA maturation chaperone TorD
MSRGVAEMQSIAVQRVQKPAPLMVEDQARADWYGLLAALWQAPAPESLLRDLRNAPVDSGTELGLAFGVLVEACRQFDADSIRQEFDTVFLGVGRPEVFLQASFYLTGFLHERPLADLREILAQAGLARSEAQSFTEDHMGVLCEVMRLLVQDGGEQQSNLEFQQQVFGSYIGPSFEALCDALERSESAQFYKALAPVARAFFAIERQAFDFV